MYMFRMEEGSINPEIAYRAETLAEPNNIRARQAAGTVHVHPNGRFVYGANRAEATTEFQGKQVFKGGENSILVYSIDQSTGEPTPIQHIETQKIHPRTFHIDPSGRLLVAQHNLPVNVKDGNVVAVGHIDADVAKVEAETAGTKPEGQILPTRTRSIMTISTERASTIWRKGTMPQTYSPPATGVASGAAMRARPG
jgi:hypothetical protein